MKTNVRCANKKDMSTLIKLHVKLLEFEGIESRDEDKIAYAFNKIIDSKDTHIMLIEHEGDIAGMCTVHSLISSVEGGNLALIEDVYIDENYRKKGLGLILMKEVEEFCKRNSYKRIQLLCRANNEIAINFYKKLGFAGLNMIFFYKKL
jgi:ribosomal protein S18 acetylase RimI-like enzyme